MTEDMDLSDMASQSLPSLSGGPHSFQGLSFQASPPQEPSILQWKSNDQPRDSVFVQPRIETLEERVLRHEEETFNEILDSVRNSIRKKTQKIIDEQLNQAWQRNRQVWMQEIKGNRTLGGSSSDAFAKPLLPAPQNQGSTRQQPQLLSALPTANIPLRPSDVRMHLEILRSTNDIHEIIRNFQLKVDGSSGTPSDSGYAVAWRLVEQLSHKPHSPVSRAAATMSYLSKQIFTIIHKRVRAAGISKQDISIAQEWKSQTATLCAKFVKLTLGDVTDPWPTLFYCLRCGDAVAALEVFSNGTDLNEPVIQRTLSNLVSTQESQSCFWDGVLPRINQQDRESIATILSSVSSESVHKQGFLALLAGEGLPESNAPGFGTIEDYLAGTISQALLRENPEHELKEVAESINEYGVSYFGTDSGAWAFAWPLLATQQYRKALSHLANVDGSTGLMQAAHLALALDAVSIDIEDLGQELSKENFATALLVAYAGDLPKSDPASLPATLEYISRIPERKRRRKEAALILSHCGTPDHLQHVAGTLGVDGRRNPGSELEKFFSAEDADEILEEAGNIMSREGVGENLQCAVLCFTLAGRYDKTLDKLNRLLCPPNRVDQERITWINLSKQFHEHYLNRSSFVVDTLKREKKEGLIEASRVLLQMNEVFSHLEANQYAQAWKLASETKLIPTSEEDAPLKEEQYMRLDPVIKDAFPDFLVGIMQALQQEHRLMKREMHLRSSRIGQERLRQIETVARLLMRFSSLVQMDSERVETLTRLESLMR